jgi:hypothetical protein
MRSAAGYCWAGNRGLSSSSFGCVGVFVMLRFGIKVCRRVAGWMWMDWFADIHLGSNLVFESSANPTASPRPLF